jgi:hypothetical protein
MDVDFAIKRSHHRDLKLATSPEVGIVILEYLVEAFCEERPKLVDWSKVAKLLSYMYRVVMVRLHRAITI